MRRRFLIIAGIALLIVLGMAAILSVWRWEMRNELNRAWEDWIAAGGPRSLAEVKPAPIADDRNAAVAYRPALAIIEALSEEERQRLRAAGTATLRVATHDAERRGTVADLIERLQEALAIAIGARGIEECVWDASVYDADDLVFPWVQSARDLCRALIFDAHLKAERDMIDDALLSLEAALALSAHLGSDPFIIMHLSHINHDLMAMEAIEEVFRDRDFPADSPIVQIVKDRDFRGGVRMMVMADALWGLSWFDRLSEWEHEMSQRPAEQTPIGYRWLHWWFRDLDKAAYMDAVRSNAIALSQPATARTVQFVDNNDLPPYALTAWMFLPGHGAFEMPIVRAEARRLMFLEALQLREYRAENGEYPDSWTMPADPMTGDPMRYERDEEGGFVMESDFVERRTQERLRWTWR